MNALLICPNERPALVYLTASRPVAILPVLGDTLLGYWLNECARREWTRVRIIAADRADQIREEIGDGHRWGVKAEVVQELRELSVEAAREAHAPPGSGSEFPVIFVDRLPGQTESLLRNYDRWFHGLLSWMPEVPASGRVGLREERPGIWIGHRASIAATARMEAPCWLGENVSVGPGAVLGPNCILEDRVVVEGASTIADSAVGPDTFVGQLTNVTESIAAGSTLINWRTGSHTIVPDEFLLSPLKERGESIGLKRGRGGAGRFARWWKAKMPCLPWFVRSGKRRPAKR